MLTPGTIDLHRLMGRHLPGAVYAAAGGARLWAVSGGE